MRLTYRYRLKDKCARRLASQARAVNFVWNYCNETQQKAARSGRQWLSGYDLWRLVAGATKCGLDLHSHSAMRVCLQYDKSRRQHKKPWLKWRSKRSLGWVPFPEQFTTQVCSACGSLPPSRPRGIAGLSKRVWRCDDCGTEHDRDCNAARNILRVGLDTLNKQEPRHA